MSSETFDLGDGRVMVNVHSPTACQGQWCVIHNQKPSHMNQWPLHWRSDRYIFERICPHGVGHYDPSQDQYHRALGRNHESVHGCDGCCVPQEEE